MKKLACLLLALCLLIPTISWANRAEVLLLPTRVVMENGDRFTTVVVKNTGNATGNFSVSLIDMEMKEDGLVVPQDPGKTDPLSAIPYLRIAPRSMTLKPGETQNVRIMVRKPESLPAGEYRSHLRVSLDNDNVEGTADSTTSDMTAPGQKPEAHIAVKANLVLIIPVILRNGETTLSMKIIDPKITRDNKGKPSLALTLLRAGTRSSMGDFTITYTGPGGSKIIKSFPGVPVYRPLDKRTVSIPLDDIPAGVDLNHGKLDIVYTAQAKEGTTGEKLAEAQLSLAH